MKKTKTILSIVMTGMLVFLCYILFKTMNKSQVEILSKYVCNNKPTIKLYDEEAKQIKKIKRGKQIKIYEQIKEISQKKYYLLENGLYIKENNICNKESEVVQEKKIFVKTSATILNNLEESYPLSLALKKEQLEAIGFDKVDDQGEVNYYKIKQGELEGFLARKYTVLREQDLDLTKEEQKILDYHLARQNPYLGGLPANLEYNYNEKPKFKKNVMPDKVYALYLNNGWNVINNIDKYLDFVKDTKINAFVVDIKDNTTPGYKSEVFKKYSPTNYNKGITSFEKYKESINKLKSANYYVIGRITVFKDEYFAKDYQEGVITNKATGQAFNHNGAYWPSAFNRKVWEFNVELAKEAVTEFGFNEIQFDYVRFPDRTYSLEKNGVLDFKNIYNEEKGEAIQRFLMYARDELHKLETYISADVFGESARNYVTGYGQYFPAISNVVDVISAMPYPDHFAAYSYGIAKPWNEPFELMKNWGKEAYQRQQEILSPAKVRTWIQAYNVLSYVDKDGIAYNHQALSDQINGLVAAGLTDGYMTWNSASSLTKYELQKEAFRKDY